MAAIGAGGGTEGMSRGQEVCVMRERGGVGTSRLGLFLHVIVGVRAPLQHEHE